MSQVRQSSSWWPNGFSFNRKTVGEAGKRDGEAAPAIPPWRAQTLPPFLRELWRAGQMDAQLLAKKWTQEDKELKDTWRKKRKKREQVEKRRQRAKEKRERSRARYEEKHGVPAPDTMPGRKAYVALLIAWLIAELPINGIAFQLFGESLVFAVVGALLVAMVLLPSAHYLGKLLRNTSSWTWKKITFGSVLAALPLGVIVAVSHLRESYTHYLRAKGESPGLVHLGDGSAFWVLATLNTALFAVATYVAFKKHPKWAKDVRQADADLEEAREQHEEADEACVEAATTRRAAFEEKQAEMAHLQQQVLKLAERYRDRNLHARPDCDEQVPDEEDLEEGDAYPRSFELALTLEVPEALQDLDWSLTDGPPPRSAAASQDAGSPPEASGEGASEERSAETNGRASGQEAV